MNEIETIRKKLTFSLKFRALHSNFFRRFFRKSLDISLANYQPLPKMKSSSRFLRNSEEVYPPFCFWEHFCCWMEKGIWSISIFITVLFWKVRLFCIKCIKQNFKIVSYLVKSLSNMEWWAIRICFLDKISTEFQSILYVSLFFLILIIASKWITK